MGKRHSFSQVPRGVARSAKLDSACDHIVKPEVCKNEIDFRTRVQNLRGSSIVVFVQKNVATIEKANGGALAHGYALVESV